MKIETKNYVCFICGKRNVKLWRPYMGTEPLICAECAEKCQTPRENTDGVWKKDLVEGKQAYVKIPNGKIITLPKWKVDEKGKIPSPYGPGPDELPECMTDQLSVDLSDVSTCYTSGETSMIPACPDEEGEFWGYTSVPEEISKWWEELPTR